MAQREWRKLNLPKSTTYIEMPLEFTENTVKGGVSLFEGLTGTAQILLATIHTLCKLFKEPAKVTYNYLNTKYGMSREPIAYAFEQLTSRGIIKNVGQSRYEIVVEYKKKNYIKIDDYLYKQEFAVYDESGNVVKYKRLTRSAIKHLALLQRHYNNPKTNDKFKSSQARMGAALHLPRTTAGDSIRELIATSAISCEKAENDHGDSKRGLYIYEVNPEIMAVERKKEKAEPSEPSAKDIAAAQKLFSAGDEDYTQHAKKKTKRQKMSIIERWDSVLKEIETVQNGAEKEQKTRAAVEQHFYDLRHAAEERANAVQAKANADKEYNTISKRLSELAREIAFAELQDQTKAARLSEEKQELETAGDKRLAALGINKSELAPQYSCKICNDTGYDTRGKPCTCLTKFIEDMKN